MWAQQSSGYRAFRPLISSDDTAPVGQRSTSDFARMQSSNSDWTLRSADRRGSDWSRNGFHEELHSTAYAHDPVHQGRRRIRAQRVATSPRHATHRSFASDKEHAFRRLASRDRYDSAGSLASDDGFYQRHLESKHGIPGMGPARDRLTPGIGLGFSLEDLFRPVKIRLDEVESGIDEVQRVNDITFRRARLNTTDLSAEMFEKAMNAETGRLHAENLQGHHFTNEDLCRVIFERCNREDDHELDNFRDMIRLDPKGGLDRIADIWNPAKYLYFLVLMLCCIFNFAFIVSLNYSIFHFWTYGVVLRTENFFRSVSDTDLTNLFKYDLGNVTEGAATDAFKEALHQHMQLSGLMLIQDGQKRIIFMQVAIVVALMESGWILTKLMLCMRLWWIFAFDSSEYRSYRALSYAFQKLLPQFSNFSAIKLMARVHPALLYNEYISDVSDSVYGHHTMGLIYIHVCFIGKLVLSASLALGAFLVKLVVVGLNLVNPAYSSLFAVLGVAGLLNQCIGCVVMEIVLQDRLFLFMFGGRESTYKADQLAYKNVYECRVAKTIWETYWHGKGADDGQRRRIRALVLLATFDHYDVQMLVMDRFDASFERMVGLSCVEESQEEHGYDEHGHSPARDGDDDEDEGDPHARDSSMISDDEAGVENVELSQRSPSADSPAQHSGRKVFQPHLGRSITSPSASGKGQSLPGVRGTSMPETQLAASALRHHLADRRMSADSMTSNASSGGSGQAGMRPLVASMRKEGNRAYTWGDCHG